MKIGQMVKIVKKIDMAERPRWVSSMDQTVGHTGIIQDISMSGNAIKVHSPVNGSWWYAPEALDPISEYNVGDKVKIVKKVTSDDAPCWVTDMEATVGEVGEVIELSCRDRTRVGDRTRVYVRTSTGCWWYDFASLEKVVTLPTIVTEKIVRGGKKCRRIVSFKNMPTKESWGECPNKPYYYVCKSYRENGSRHDVNTEGRPFWNHNGSGDQFIEFMFEDEHTDIDIHVPYLNLKAESVFLEDTFQAIVKQLKICQRKLEKISKIEWDGIEEVII